MKIKFYFLALFFLSTYQISAQAPITIGGSCSNTEALGVYNYDGDINGKPSYRKGVAVSDCSTYTDDAACSAADSGIYLVKWNGSAWVWSKDTAGCVWIVQLCVLKSADDVGILATNTGDTALPPCSGWVAEATGCIPDITTGCESLSVFQNTFSSNIALYPNPTNGTISIDLGSINSSINVRLMSLIGKVIWTKGFNNTSSIQLDINQPTGIYLLELTGAKGEKAFLKLVKE